MKKNDINKVIGLKLKILRESHRLGQVELSVEIDRPSSTVSDDERGINNITLAIIEKYLKFYKIKFNDFFSDVKLP